MTFNILVCDDLESNRMGLRLALISSPDMKVIGEADGEETVIAAARRLQPGVVLMDVVLVDGNGMAATRRLLAGDGKLKVVAVSMHSDVRYVRAMLNAGASGYVLKSCAYEELARAIRTVMAGETYTSPDVSRAMQISASIRSSSHAL